MSYTDDEVRAAKAVLDEVCAQAVKYARLQGEGMSDSVLYKPLLTLSWAASEYLKAKPVIEWYVDCKCEMDNAKAREYLEKLNQNNGE